MLAVAELAPHVGLSSACQAFALNRGFVYRDRARHRVTASRRIPKARPRPPLSLSIAEQDLLLGLLDSERFADVAPAAPSTPSSQRWRLLKIRGYCNKCGIVRNGCYCSDDECELSFKRKVSLSK